MHSWLNGAVAPFSVGAFSSTAPSANHIFVAALSSTRVFQRIQQDPAIFHIFKYDKIMSCYCANDQMSHWDGIHHLAKTREEMRDGLIIRTEQRDIDALMNDDPENYADTPMELLWPSLQHTERFSDPTGAVDTELRRSMVATHRVGNPAGSTSRFQLMTHTTSMEETVERGRYATTAPVFRRHSRSSPRVRWEHKPSESQTTLNKQFFVRCRRSML